MSVSRSVAAGLVSIVLALPAGAAFEVPAAVKKGLKGNDDQRAAAAKEAMESGAEAVALVLPLAATDRHTHVRDVAFTALVRSDAPGVGAELVRLGVGAKDPLVRAVAIEALAARREQAAAEAVAAKLADPEPDVRLAAVEALGAMKARAARPALEALVAAKGSALLRAAAVEAISRAGGEGVLDVLLRFAADPEPAVAAQALRSLRYHDAATAGTAAAGVLADPEETGPEPGPRLYAALEVAKAARRKEPIAPLIELLAHPRERVVAGALDALGTITGLELQPEQKAWREWWSHYGADFEPPVAGGPPREVRSRARFFGLPVASDRVAFVLDLSGSMREPDATGKPRVEAARAALRQALESLAEDAEFALVTFADGTSTWKDAPVKASRKNVQDALAYFERQSPKGKTNLFDGVARALELQGIDTVVLLSDGAPSGGPYQYFQRVERHLGRLLRLRPVAISAVALAERDDARRFLKDLAESTGGRYVEP